MKIKNLFVILLLIFSGMQAISAAGYEEGTSPSSDANNQKTGIANPASVYCIEQGGTLEIQKDKTGGEYGLCYFNDKGVETVCEEWAFYRGECKKGEIKKKIDGGIPPYPYDGLENATVECIWDENYVCIEIYAPVCGIDGKTYSNSCHADSQCVKIAYEGECKNENKNTNQRCIGGKEGERCGLSPSIPIIIGIVSNSVSVGNEVMHYSEGEKPIVSVDVESAEAGMQGIEIKPTANGYGTITSYDSMEKPISAEFTNDLKIQENSLILVDGQSKEYKVEVLPNVVYEKVSSTASTKINSIELKAENAKAVYDVKAQKNVRILGMVDATADMNYYVDATSGKTELKKAPWWFFLAIESQ